jgi:hypothetical protein
MNWDDEALDQTPAEERRRQQKMARQVKMPREDILSVTEGAPGYRGVATALKIAGQDFIIMAKNGSALHIVHQNITNFAEYKTGLVHKCVLMSARDVQIDDDL